jgi:hypothetical protein
VGLYLPCGEFPRRFGEDLGPVYLIRVLCSARGPKPLPSSSPWRVRLRPVEPVHGGPGGFPDVFLVVSVFLTVRLHLFL